MKTIFLLTVVSVSISMYAQDVLKSPDVLPPSPEAAALAKNINIPVSYSSGTPQISIPIYTVKSGLIELSVSVGYNASGIRVDETATWVGLGWNLNAGAQITRSVRGAADERPTWGYMNVNNNRKVKYVNTAHCRCGAGGTETWAIENDLINYQLDLEPDQFNFSILGYSGDFYYNQDSAKFILVPYQNILVEGSPGNFILTLPNGIKAFFGCNDCEEQLLSGTTTSYIDGVSYSPEPLPNAPQSNSWMISRITDPLGKSITFSYTPEWNIIFGRGGERFGASLASSNQMMRRQSFYRQYIKKPVIQSITGDNVHMIFKRSSSKRLDIPDYMGGSRSLDTITITTRNQIEIRSFYFQYGYFVSPSYPVSHILDISGFAEEARKRLYLRSITEKNGNQALPPYEFNYNPVELPSRFSTAQDYWGYYNGKPNGVHLMPKIPSLSFNVFSPYYNETNKILPAYNTYFNSTGSDRRIDTAFTQARILTRVKYPTGGSTEYYYEQNKVAVDQLNIYGGMVPPDMVERSYTLSSVSNPIPAEPPYPLNYSGTFKILEPATEVRITPQLSTCTYNYNPSCRLTVNIRSLPFNTLVRSINTTTPINIPLSKGDYLVEVVVSGSPYDPLPYFHILFEWGERKDPVNFTVGGVRVRKIISRDGTGNSISRSYSYNIDSSSKSSGIIEGCPSYKVYDLNAQMEIFRQYFVSNSVLPLTSDGKTVRYQYVTEFYDSTHSSFKTTYSFTSGLSEPGNFAKARTGAPLLSWSWQNNLLKKKQVFEKTSTGYRVLAEEENFYQFYRPVIELYGLYGPQIIPYNIATEWYLPDSTTTFSYAYENGQKKMVKSGQKIFYNSFYLPSATRTTNSKGEIIDNKIWYPVDFNNVQGYNIQSLQHQRIWTIPVRQELSLNGKLISGSVVRYKENGLPLQGFGYENPQLADTMLHNKDIVLPPHYQLRSTISYDARNNIRQVNDYRNGAAAYIWDYQVNTYYGVMNEIPVAMVKNGDSASIAYTSFENAGKGNWNYSGSAQIINTIMGERAYSLSKGNIIRSGLRPLGTYIVSYWSNMQNAVSQTVSVKKGMTIGNWTYFEHKVLNPVGGLITVAGTGLIDELRLYPEKAQMTTYAYDQLWMIRSVCDLNNRVSYYEYDGFGRLSLVRDQEKNILKKYCYNYFGQPENCGLGNDPQWQLDSTYCEMINGAYTGTLVRVERDGNPNSPGYNQVRSSGVPNAAECTGTSGNSCTGVDQKMINGICETGNKIYTGSVRLLRESWRCFFYYQWSDGSVSAEYEEVRSAPCAY